MCKGKDRGRVFVVGVLKDVKEGEQRARARFKTGLFSAARLKEPRYATIEKKGYACHVPRMSQCAIQNSVAAL